MVYLEGGEAQPGRRKDAQGRVVTLPSSFRSWVRRQPEPGGLPAAAGRYHLTVAMSCPWAHRTLLLRSLKGLQDAISLSVVLPSMDEEWGWKFLPPGTHSEQHPYSTGDGSGVGATWLYELYLKADKGYSGNITVPVLWDRETNTIVSNESADIAEMLNSEFDDFCSGPLVPDYYPPHLRQQVDEINGLVLKTVNAGVYKCAFASDQASYEEACTALFDTLDRLEERLQGQRYLVEYFPEPGAPPSPTLVDWRLLTTLLRFDCVYYPLFKCNIRRLRSYPALQAYMEDLYSDPRVASTISFSDIIHGYSSSSSFNPKRIVPRGPLPFTPLPAASRRQLGLPTSVAAPAAAEEASLSGDEANGTPAGKPAPVQGEFVRPDSRHRGWVTADGSGAGGYKAEAGRYHIYVANNCPWCHRVATMRAVLGLQGAISMDTLFYRRDPDRGWQFKPDEPGCTADTVNGFQFIRQLYEKVGSKEKSVPVLWDKQTQTIVNNESSEIIRMLATAFGSFHRPGAPELYPSNLASAIDAVNEWVYTDINNGAYRAGFASSQTAYEIAFDKFFAAMDRLEAILESNRFLMGNAVTEADVRLFPTLFRFDHVYFSRFLLNKALMVESYPNLQRWMMDMYSIPGVADASNIDHCKKGYFGRTGNNLIPLGPHLNYSFAQ